MRRLTYALVVAVLGLEWGGCSSAEVGDTTSNTSEALVSNAVPAITIYNPKPNQTVIIGTPFVVNGVAAGTAASPVDEVTVQIDGGPVQEANIIRRGGGVSFTSTVEIAGPPGSHVVNVVAIMDNGLFRASVTVVAACASGTLWCPNACVAPDSTNACARTMFVTSQPSYTGNLQGLTGADEICQQLAQGARLGGSYRAWLSDSDIAASNRVGHLTYDYYRRTDKTAIANNWSGLLSGTLLAPISCDENSSCGLNESVWTNTTSNGSGSPSDCDKWTSIGSNLFSFGGVTTATDGGWTSSPTNSTPACLDSEALYCVQQSPSTPFMDFAKPLTVGQNLDGRLEVFSVPTGGAIFHDWQKTPDGQWNGQTSLGGAALQMAVAENPDGTLVILYIGTNNALYYNAQDPVLGGWQGERQLGGWAKQMAIGQNADGRLEIFYVGTDTHLYHNSQVTPGSQTWNGEMALGGSALQISVAQNLNGTLEVFYVGTDGHLYHNWQVPALGRWNGEVQLPTPFSLGVSQVVPARNRDGRLEIFYLGAAGVLYHNWQQTPAGGWNGETALGDAGSEITVGQNKDGTLEVFYIGLNNAIYHNRQNQNGWSGPRLLGGAASLLTVGENLDGRLEVFSIGTDGRLYQSEQSIGGDDFSAPTPM